MATARIRHARRVRRGRRVPAARRSQRRREPRAARYVRARVGELAPHAAGGDVGARRCRRSRARGNARPAVRRRRRAGRPDRARGRRRQHRGNAPARRGRGRRVPARHRRPLRMGAGGHRRVAYTLQNLRNEPFTVDTLRTSATNGVVFVLDVPRVADPPAHVRPDEARRQAPGAHARWRTSSTTTGARSTMPRWRRSASRSTRPPTRCASSGIEPGSPRALALFGA